MVTPGSTNPAVTAVGDYIFRVCFIDPFQGAVLAKFARTTLGAKRVDERAQPRHHLARRRHFHRLARVHEPALHVDDDERRAPGLGREDAFEDLRPVSHRSPGRMSLAMISTCSGS